MNNKKHGLVPATVKAVAKLPSSSLVTDGFHIVTVPDPSIESHETQTKNSRLNYADFKDVNSRKHLVLGKEYADGNCKDMDSFMTNENSIYDSRSIETLNPYNNTLKKKDVFPCLENNLGASAQLVLNSKEDVDQINAKVKPEHEKKLPALRMDALTPSPEAKINKRPSVICDFFAKGWCIKGSSCRFLHIKDAVNHANEHHNGDQAIKDFPRPNQLDEVEHPERRRKCQSVNKQESCSLKGGDFSCSMSPRSHNSTSAKRGFDFSSSSCTLLSENVKKRWVTPDLGGYTSPTNQTSYVQGNLLPERQSSLSAQASASSNWQCESTSYLHDAQLDACYSRASMSPSARASAWAKASSAMPASFMSRIPTSSQCLPSFDVDDKRLELSRRISLSSLTQANDPFFYEESKSKVCQDDWQPSVPFRPSLIIMPITSSPGSQYDPLLDSIDLPSTGGKSFNFTFINPETPVHDKSNQLVFGGGGGASLQHRHWADMANKEYVVTGKDSLASGDVDQGVLMMNGDDFTLNREVGASAASHGEDVHDTSTYLGGGEQVDRYRKSSQKELKRGKIKQDNEKSACEKTDINVQKESKAQRYFRASLVDVVKELLKPTWRDGHLSKDSHNKIVKKVTEKVISIMHPHQIPTTLESAKQYLSVSRPKILKLVEGYVTRFGKS